MLDIETLGLRPGSSILSVAAVEFEIDGQRDRSFYANITRASCKAAGLREEEATLAWWRGQSAEAKAALQRPPPRPLRDVVEEFVTWFIECKIHKIWSHGAAFDVPLWQEAICAIASTAPWKHWNVRDTRTLYELAGLDVRTMQRKGVEHNALDDANFQIDCVAAAYNKLGQRLL